MSDAYVPPFTITDKMVDSISSISNLLGRIHTGGSLDRNPHLRRSNRIQSIHSSLAIENNTLTLSQVTDIINGKPVIGPYTEILEVKNAGEAYSRLAELNPYSETDLLATHQTLMSGLIKEAGKFRTCGVGVFSGETCIHLAPPAALVPGEMQNLLQWCEKTTTHPLIKSSVFHFELEFIHPFADGNGRIGRIWQTLILSKWDAAFIWVPIETLILGRQKEYYDALNAAGKCGNSTVFVEFMLETIEQALLSHSTDTINETINDTINETVNEVERAVLLAVVHNSAITISQMVKETGYSRSTILRSIAELKAKQKLVRNGSNKKGSWQII